MHTIVQVPQLLVSLFRSTLQPFARNVPSQLSKPALQVPLQFPPAHALVAMLKLEQAALQPPQLLGSELTSTLQPLARSVLSQLLKPGVHVPLQLPPVHPFAATLTPEQGAVQPPQ